MNHVSDWLTHIDNPEDVPYLRTKLLDVNMRLYRANEDYAGVVMEACKHITNHCLEKLEGYKLPHGTSGANLGIPWNIIGIAMNRGAENATCLIMINPRIISRWGERISDSNCGSIRLPAPIKVKRSEEIHASWFSTEGTRLDGHFYPDTGSFTIQHEIDHNNGILITDRQP